MSALELIGGGSVSGPVGGALTGAANVGLVDSVIGSLTGNPLGWLNAGSSLISGLVGIDKPEVSQAQTASGSSGQALLNTSGWAVGKNSSANGGGLDAAISANNLDSLPWYIWAAGTLVAVAIVKRVA